MGAVSGEINFGVMASGLGAGLDDQMLRWYDRWLKGVDNGVDREPPVSIFTMGENRWRKLPSWPPPDVTYQPWFLHSAGKANTLAGNGVLSPEPPAGDQPTDHFLYDPRDAVPTRARSAEPVSGRLGRSPPMNRAFTRR